MKDESYNKVMAMRMLVRGIQKQIKNYHNEKKVKEIQRQISDDNMCYAGLFDGTEHYMKPYNLSDKVHSKIFNDKARKKIDGILDEKVSGLVHGSDGNIPDEEFCRFEVK